MSGGANAGRDRRTVVAADPARFQDFENSLHGLTPSVLSSRLKQLESSGVIESRLYAEHPPRPEYSLTEKGRELGPVLRALKEWGEKHAR